MNLILSIISGIILFQFISPADIDVTSLCVIGSVVMIINCIWG